MNNKNVRYRKKYYITIPMTTVIGIKCIDGIAIGSNSQLTIGGDNPAKEIGFDKIFEIRKMLIACAGDTEYFEKLRSEIEKRYISEFKDIKEAADIVESSVKYIYDNYPKRDENFSEILFCISAQNKAYLFRIDSYHCFALEVKDFYPIGSGGVFGKYILKRVWDTNLTMIGASFVLTYVINETTKIDQYSNPPIYIALMFKTGLISFLKREHINIITKTLSLADKRTKSYFKNLIIKPQESTEITIEALMEKIKDEKGKV